jgi:hypothetical protein
MSNFDSPEFFEGDVALFRDHVALPYLAQRTADQAAAALRAELSKPLARVNDPATLCRVLTANFRHREHGGEIYTPDVGDVITMPATDAACNVALGRVEILK